ncbi:MAG TPA: rRNA maturation RNase YbeY [Capsulimonadaceae bacterium]
MSVLLCGDTFIRDLNYRYRSLDKPTDVLSFPQDDPECLGDIVISIDTAERQAAAASWPLESELALLAVHGLLHLVGHDDEDEDGAAEMERLTRLILTKAEIALPPSEHPFFQSIAP